MPRTTPASQLKQRQQESDQTELRSRREVGGRSTKPDEQSLDNGKAAQALIQPVLQPHESPSSDNTEHARCGFTNNDTPIPTTGGDSSSGQDQAAGGGDQVASSDARRQVEAAARMDGRNSCSTTSHECGHHLTEATRVSSMDADNNVAGQIVEMEPSGALSNDSGESHRSELCDSLELSAR